MIQCNMLGVGPLTKYGVRLIRSPFAKEHRARAPADAWPRDLASKANTGSARLTVKTAYKTLFPVKRSMFLQFADCSAAAPRSLRRM